MAMLNNQMVKDIKSLYYLTSMPNTSWVTIAHVGFS